MVFIPGNSQWNSFPGNSRENLQFLSTFLPDFPVKDSLEFSRIPGKYSKEFSKFSAKLLPGENQTIGLQRNIVWSKIRLLVYKGMLYLGKWWKNLKTFPKMHRPVDIIEIYVNYVHVHYMCILFSCFRNVAKT